MSKYIVKNCPAFDCKYNECHIKIGNHKLYCMDCTDCLLKRIVEKMKDHPFCDCSCGGDVLELLEIQECE